MKVPLKIQKPWANLGVGLKILLLIIKENTFLLLNLWIIRINDVCNLISPPRVAFGKILEFFSFFPYLYVIKQLLTLSNLGIKIFLEKP